MLPPAPGLYPPKLYRAEEAPDDAWWGSACACGDSVLDAEADVGRGAVSPEEVDVMRFRDGDADEDECDCECGGYCGMNMGLLIVRPDVDDDVVVVDRDTGDVGDVVMGVLDAEEGEVALLLLLLSFSCSI